MNSTITIRNARLEHRPYPDCGKMSRSYSEDVRLTLLSWEADIAG